MDSETNKLMISTFQMLTERLSDLEEQGRWFKKRQDTYDCMRLGKFTKGTFGTDIEVTRLAENQDDKTTVLLRSPTILACTIEICFRCGVDRTFDYTEIYKILSTKHGIEYPNEDYIFTRDLGITSNFTYTHYYAINLHIKENFQPSIPCEVWFTSDNYIDTGDILVSILFEDHQRFESSVRMAEELCTFLHLERPIELYIAEANHVALEITKADAKITIACSRANYILNHPHLGRYPITDILTGRQLRPGDVVRDKKFGVTTLPVTYFKDGSISEPNGTVESIIPFINREIS